MVRVTAPHSRYLQRSEHYNYDGYRPPDPVAIINNKTKLTRPLLRLFHRIFLSETHQLQYADPLRSNTE
jgi:hypothetical protein